MKKSAIPLNNKRRIALQKQQQQQQPDFRSIDQVIQHYVHTCPSPATVVPVLNPICVTSCKINEAICPDSLTPPPPQQQPHLVDQMNTEEDEESHVLPEHKYPYGLQNPLEFFTKLNHCVEVELSAAIAATTLNNNVQSNDQSVATTTTRDSVQLLQSLFKKWFKSKYDIRKSYASELRIPNCFDSRDKFVRENQIQVLLSFMFLLKLKSSDRINKKKLDMIYGLLGNCHSFFYDASEEFNCFLRRTLLFEPLITQFPKVISSLFKKFVLKVPEEVQKNVVKKEGQDLSSSQNSNSTATGHLDDQLFQEVRIGGVPADDAMMDEEFRPSNTYEELMANMKRNPDFFNRRLLLDTPSHPTYRMKSTTQMPSAAPQKTTSYTRGVDVAPTPDFTIGTGKKKKTKRKLILTKRPLNITEDIEQTLKKRKLTSEMHVC